MATKQLRRSDLKQIQSAWNGGELFPVKPIKTKSFYSASEFYVRNLTGSDIPAYSIIGIRGFSKNFNSFDEAKKTLLNRGIVFDSISATYSYPISFVLTLESIKKEKIGVAKSTKGSLVFGVVAGTDSVTTSSKFITPYSGVNYGKFQISDAGYLQYVAFDSTTRFCAAVPVPPPVVYTAGEGIYISASNEISSEAGSFNVGFQSGTSYSFSYSVPTRGYYQARLLFTSDFKKMSRVDDGVGGAIGLNTTTKSVVTEVNFAQQTVTKETIKVLN